MATSLASVSEAHSLRPRKVRKTTALRPGRRGIAPSGITIFDHRVGSRIKLPPREVLAYAVHLRDREGLEFSEVAEHLRISRSYLTRVLTLERLLPGVWDIGSDFGQDTFVGIARLLPELQLSVARKLALREMKVKDLKELLEDPSKKAPTRPRGRAKKPLRMVA